MEIVEDDPFGYGGGAGYSSVGSMLDASGGEGSDITFTPGFADLGYHPGFRIDLLRHPEAGLFNLDPLLDVESYAAGNEAYDGINDQTMMDPGSRQQTAGSPAAAAIQAAVASEQQTGQAITDSPLFWIAVIVLGLAVLKA